MVLVRRSALAVLLLAVLAAAWVGWRGLQARDDEAARVSLAQAKDALADQRLDDAAAAVDAAGDRTRRAADLTGDPVFRLSARVPVLGRTLAVARGLARASDELAREVLPDALDVARTVDPERLRARDGRVDIALLQQAAPGLRRAAERAADVERDTDRLPTSLVAGPVRDAQGSLVSQVADLAGALRGASQAVDLAPALLGADRPRRYFVLVQQTAESRGTGGLPGGFAVLEADQGRVRVTSQGVRRALQEGRIPPPPGVSQDYVDLYDPEGAFELWVNVNVSPDLPSVARVVAARWERQSGEQVDGVIALDAIALAALLRGSGPVDLGDRRIPTDQLVDYLAVGQYAGVPRGEQDVRKDKLAAAAVSASRRLTQGGGSTRELLSGLADAVGSGHLRMASDDPALRPDLERAGVTGALPTGPAPVVYPVVFNATGGKLDHFLDRSVDYRTGSCADGRRLTTVEVTLRNSAPPSGLPPYVLIYNRAGVETQEYDNAVVLVVYGTRGALLDTATLDGVPVSLLPGAPGVPYLTEQVESGLPLWSLRLELPRGQARRLVLQLDEPAVQGEVRVPEQPLSRPLVVRTDVTPC